jgi:hypothetical protein
MNNTIKHYSNSSLHGLEALAKVNAILACPCDGRNIENDAVGYIDLLQEAFLYLSTENNELHRNISGLLQQCRKNNIDTSKFTRISDEF